MERGGGFTMRTPKPSIVQTCNFLHCGRAAQVSILGAQEKVDEKQGVGQGGACRLRLVQLSPSYCQLCSEWSMGAEAKAFLLCRGCRVVYVHECMCLCLRVCVCIGVSLGAASPLLSLIGGIAAYELFPIHGRVFV